MSLRRVLSVVTRGVSLLWTLILISAIGTGAVVFESAASDFQLDDARAVETVQSDLRALPAGADVARPLAASSITIYASKDNTLYESSSGSRSNGVGEHFFVGRNDDGKIRRAVIAFDIEGNLPAGATVTNATLVLHMSRSHAAQVSIELRRLLADWGEGISDASENEGGGASATIGDATWLHTFFNTSFWAKVGGDFSGVASATALVGGTGSYSWSSTPLMVADVQEWLDEPTTNYGWLLLGDETRAQTTKRFDTRENTDPANRPALVVEYVLVPTLTVNYADGAPGSFFSFTGDHYPANSPVTLAVNGQALGTVSTDAGGHLVFLLSTAGADAGSYIVVVGADPGATARFVLGADKLMRPQEGDGPILSVPSGIALTEFIYLPIAFR